MRVIYFELNFKIQSIQIKYQAKQQYQKRIINKYKMKRIKSTKQTSFIPQGQSSQTLQETQLYDKLTKLEENIHSKLSQVKKLKCINYLCQHTNKISQRINIGQKTIGEEGSQYLTLEETDDVKEYDSETNYYDKFWKLFLMNENAAWKIDQLYDNIEEIDKATHDIERMFLERDELIKQAEEIGNQKLAKKSQMRSSQSSFGESGQEEIKIMCPYKDCFKLYCSEIALNLHIKLKHNGGNKSEREFFAEKIWMKREMMSNISQQKDEGKDITEFEGNIKLPPGYLEEYGMVTERLSVEAYEKLKAENDWVGGQVDKKLAKRISTNSDNKKPIHKTNSSI